VGRSRATVRRLVGAELPLHGYRPGPTDAKHRTTCATCGRLWEDRCHVHDVRTYDGPRVVPDGNGGRRRRRV